MFPMSLPGLGSGAIGLPKLSGSAALGAALASSKEEEKRPLVVAPSVKIASSLKKDGPIILPNPAALLMGQKGSAGAIQIAKPPASKNFASALFGAGGPGGSAPGVSGPIGLAAGIKPVGSSSTASGEIIANSYHTYYSINNLAPLVQQDENLSDVLNSSNAKIFINPDPKALTKNLICFVQVQPA